MNYRGRLAPSPTGYMHAGHLATFRVAQERSVACQGCLILRVEDLDRDRCRPEFVSAMLEDLTASGLAWQEGPFFQSERDYLAILQQLYTGGWIYPCFCSRRDVLQAAGAPHEEGGEPLYPGTCRSRSAPLTTDQNWRFRVPDGETVFFHDQRLGEQSAVAGADFGDFLIWRKDGIPAYQLAVVADDAAMGITEVVRGEDLLTSTFRQLLLYLALGFAPPAFYHCPLVLDETGRRLAKRDGARRITAPRS